MPSAGVLHKQTLLKRDTCINSNATFDNDSPVGFKDIKTLAIILVSLIMTLSRGHTGQIKRTDSHNEVIMTSLQGQ